jgi:hypothetical protein
MAKSGEEQGGPGSRPEADPAGGSLSQTGIYWLYANNHSSFDNSSYAHAATDAECCQTAPGIPFFHLVEQ